MGGVVAGTWFSLLQMFSFTDGDSCLTTFLELTAFPLMPLNLCWIAALAGKARSYAERLFDYPPVGPRASFALSQGSGAELVDRVTRLRAGASMHGHPTEALPQQRIHFR